MRVAALDVGLAVLHPCVYVSLSLPTGRRAFHRRAGHVLVRLVATGAIGLEKLLAGIVLRLVHLGPNAVGGKEQANGQQQVQQLGQALGNHGYKGHSGRFWGLSPVDLRRAKVDAGGQDQNPMRVRSRKTTLFRIVPRKASSAGTLVHIDNFNVMAVSFCVLEKFENRSGQGGLAVSQRFPTSPCFRVGTSQIEADDVRDLHERHWQIPAVQSSVATMPLFNLLESSMGKVVLG